MKNTNKKFPGISQSNLVYADKVLGVGIGAAVSKIVLGLEIPGDENDTPSTTLVLPTHALLDLLNLVDNSMKNNEALQSALTEQWEQLSGKFGSSKEENPSSMPPVLKDE